MRLWSLPAPSCAGGAFEAGDPLALVGGLRLDLAQLGAVLALDSPDLGYLLPLDSLDSPDLGYLLPLDSLDSPDLGYLLPLDSLDSPDLGYLLALDSLSRPDLGYLLPLDSLDSPDLGYLLALDSLSRPDLGYLLAQPDYLLAMCGQDRSLVGKLVVHPSELVVHPSEAAEHFSAELGEQEPEDSDEGSRHAADHCDCDSIHAHKIAVPTADTRSTNRSPPY